MSAEQQESKQQAFPKKYLSKIKDMDEGFIDTVNTANTEEIKKYILNAEQNIYDIEEAKDKNEKILDLQEQLKNETGPFTESKALETAKIKYALWTLSGRGISIK